MGGGLYLNKVIIIFLKKVFKFMYTEAKGIR